MNPEDRWKFGCGDLLPHVVGHRGRRTQKFRFLFRFFIARSCRCVRGGVTLGRRSSAAAARSLGVVRRGRRRALFARGCRRGRVLSERSPSRRSRSAAARDATLALLVVRSAVPAALVAAWRSATAPSQRRLAFSAWCDVLGGMRSLRMAVGAVVSSLGAVAVAPLSRRRCLQRRAGAPRLLGARSPVLPRSRRRGARPPLFRGGGSRSWRGAAWSTARALCAWLSALSRPLWGQAPSRRSRSAAACGAALALFGARLVVPLRSRRRGIRPPLLRSGGSRSWRGVAWSAAHALCA